MDINENIILQIPTEKRGIHGPTGTQGPIGDSSWYDQYLYIYKNSINILTPIEIYKYIKKNYIKEYENTTPDNFIGFLKDEIDNYNLNKIIFNKRPLKIIKLYSSIPINNEDNKELYHKFIFNLNSDNLHIEYLIFDNINICIDPDIERKELAIEKRIIDDVEFINICNMNPQCNYHLSEYNKNSIITFNINYSKNKIKSARN